MAQVVMQPADVLRSSADASRAVPIWLVREGARCEDAGIRDADQLAWLKSVGFDGSARKHMLVPGPGGTLAGVALGIGKATAREAATYFGTLPGTLPRGAYRLATTDACDPALAALAWGLGAYRFRRYKANGGDALPAFHVAEGVDRAAIVSAVEAIWLGRDLINTPPNDMGPDELEQAARDLAARHGAQINSIVGDALLDQNFPLVHAVGRASPRAPRLIDLRWGRPDAVKVTVIGKGICFDTGGLDIKPSSAMLLMKKDMGGAASALAVAHMVMSAGLDVRLRVLIPAAENSVAGNAFRPGDVIRSRAGTTVEIGNTDAEGRLVLADALTLADEEAPDYVFTFATLTGAARVALGPDLPPFYCDDTELAATIGRAGDAVADPVWRLPMTTPYDTWLDSPVADMNNVSEGGFAGSIVAAIFLKRFVRKARHFAHFDIYGWRPAQRPLGPKGGEPQAARAVFEVLRSL